MVQNIAPGDVVNVEYTLTDEYLQEKDEFWKDPITKLNGWQGKYTETKGKGFKINDAGLAGQMVGE